MNSHFTDIVSPREAALMRAKALCAAGRLAWMEVDLATARSHLEAGLAIYRETGDKEDAIEALSSLILVASWQGEIEHALKLLHEGLSFANALPDRAALLPTLHGLGWAASWIAAPESLEPSFTINREVEALAREAGDRRSLAWALDGVAQCFYFQDDFAAARPFLAEAVRLFQDLGDWLGHGHGLWLQGSIARQQRRTEEAREFFAQVIDGPGARNTPQGIPFGFEGFAYLSIAARQPRRAARLLASSQKMREQARSVLQPLLRIEYETQLAILQTLIDPSLLQTAWAQGRAMNRDEAVHYALQKDAGEDATR